MARARSWLVEHHYLLLRERDIRRLAIAARRHHEQTLFKLIAAAVPAERELWVPRLLAPIEDGGISRREWLSAVPSSKAARGLAEQIEKVGFLKELGADRLVLPDLPLAGLEHFARRMMSRKPAALARIKDPHRTIEVACFLRLTLLRLMDGSLTLLDHQIAALWRGARERVEETQAGRLRRFRRLLGDLAGLAEDEALGAAELRSRLRRLIAPFEPERQATQVAAIRQELGRKSHDLARLLKLARQAPLVVPADHKLAVAFATLDSLAASPNALPTTTAATLWPLVAGSDRSAGSRGGPRLLSRCDPDGLEAGAAQPLYLGRSQPIPSGPGGQADPSEAVAARPAAASFATSTCRPARRNIFSAWKQV